MRHQVRPPTPQFLRRRAPSLALSALLAASLPAAEAALVIGDAGDREAGLAALDDARGRYVHGM